MELRYSEAAVSIPAERAATGPRPLWWITLGIVALAFFVTDHDVRVSVVEAFTMTADEMLDTAGGGNARRQLAFLSLAAVGIYDLARRSEQTFRLSGGLAACVLFFVAWCTASIVWSVEPGMTLRRVVVMLCCVLAAAGVARQLTPRELCQMALVLSTGFLLMGIAAEIALGAFRPWSGDYRFSGSLHPNTQGMNLAALCLSAFCLSRSSERHRSLYLGLLAFGFVFLVLTKSRTSTAGVVASLALIWSLDVSIRANVLAWLGFGWSLGMAALVVMIAGIDIEEELSRVMLMGREEEASSLTGRLPIWTELTYYVLRRPFFGHGFDSFFNAWQIDEITRTLQWPIREAHNAYIETLLTVGAVGLAALLAAVVLAMRRSGLAFLRNRDPAYAYFFGMFAFGLMNAGTESGMVTPLMVPFLNGCAICHLAFVKGDEPS